MRSALSSIALSSALLLWTGSLSALAIYRWVDEAGVVHFSDIPPPKVANPIKTLEIEESRVADSEPGGEVYDSEVGAETTRALREELDELRKELRAQQTKPI